MLDDFEPASYHQSAWVSAAIDGWSAYSFPVVWLVQGDAVTVDRLEALVCALGARHEILHTVFGRDGERIWQRIMPDARPVIRLADLSRSDNPLIELRELVLRGLGCPFDVFGDKPLWRATIARIGLTAWAIAMVWHHTIGDGWSTRLALHDAASLWDEIGGDGGELPPVDLHHADFAKWERDDASSLAAEEAWRAHLSTPPPAPALPVSSGWDGGRFDLVKMPLPPLDGATVAELRKSKRLGAAKIGPTLQALAVASVHAYVKDAGLVLGVAHTNRRMSGGNAIMGPLFDYLPVCVERRPTFPALRDEIAHALADAKATALPLAAIERAVGASRGSLFDLSVNVMPHQKSTHVEADGAIFRELLIAPAWETIPLAQPFYGAGLLAWVLRLRDGGVDGSLYVNATAIADEDAAAIAQAWQETAVKVVNDPTCALSG